MPKEPIARGVVLHHAKEGPLPTLAREAQSILRALDAPADADAPAADYVLLLVEPGGADAELPDLKDRAASAVAVAEDAAEGRVAVVAARKRLRAMGATLGSRELVFSPAQFGYLGLESDSARERLEILLRALVLDAERLRLKREGWEEP
ncbi:MAG TPA: hypothetical protein VNX21_01255 [Candidatus Thermoplasmatota archaeon]|nr:hypothetical protein [Candidatus Thermoplasmatota archaeon]